MDRHLKLMETLRYSEALEDIVTAANIAGFMEQADAIFVPDDTYLTMYLIDLRNAWAGNEDGNENFMEYAERKLLEKFGVEHEN